MKAAFSFVLIATAIFTAGSAEAAPRYDGALVVFAKSGTCPDYNPVGEQMFVRFRPGGIGDNPANTGFTFKWGNGGYSLTVPGAITNSFKTGTLTSMFDYAGTGLADIKFSSQIPATILTTTQWVYAVGSITDFDGMVGCTVTFRMSAVKRLN